MAAITLVTMGSWGDLFPFVGLGRALVARDHEVRIAASPAWGDVVRGAGVPVVGVGRQLGFEELRGHPEIFQRVPFGLRHALGRLVFDQIDELTSDLRDAMVGVDLVVTHPAQVAAHNVAEHLGVRRLVATVFAGMIPSSRTVPGGTRVGPWPGWAGRVANRLAWRSARLGTAVLFDGPINRHRRQLGLPELRASLLELSLQAEAIMVMASPHVIEPPPDWPASVCVTSFVAWDGEAERPLDETTRVFLDGGAPPVLVTLGSNGAIDPDDFFEHATRLVLHHGVRALVVTGPGGRADDVTGLDGVHVREYVAFSAIMGRCRAAVHHGGVGTTVAAIRAGLPQVVVPKGFDQPDTAACVEALGIGLAVPWHKRHRRLAPTLHQVLSDPLFGQQAAALGAVVRAEDGATMSADIIESHLPRASHGRPPKGQATVPVVWGTLASADLSARGTGRAAPDHGNLCRVAWTPASRTVLAAGLTFLAAAIGITTLWFALNTRSWDELEAVLVPPLIVGAALAAVWACVLGVGLLVQWTWARWWALLTFVVVSAFSGLALLDTVRRVVDGDTTPVRHVAAPAGLLVVAVSVVFLLTREVDRS